MTPIPPRWNTVNETYICSYSVDLMGVSEEKKGGDNGILPSILFCYTLPSNSFSNRREFLQCKDFQFE
jgi:hypothetical protein